MQNPNCTLAGHLWFECHSNFQNKGQLKVIFTSAVGGEWLCTGTMDSFMFQNDGQPLKQPQILMTPSHCCCTIEKIKKNLVFFFNVGPLRSSFFLFSQHYTYLYNPHIVFFASCFFVDFRGDVHSSIVSCAGVDHLIKLYSNHLQSAMGPGRDIPNYCIGPTRP